MLECIIGFLLASSCLGTGLFFGYCVGYIFK